jgi:hypothetical protein
MRSTAVERQRGQRAGRRLFIPVTNQRGSKCPSPCGYADLISSAPARPGACLAGSSGSGQTETTTDPRPRLTVESEPGSVGKSGQRSVGSHNDPVARDDAHRVRRVSRPGDLAPGKSGAPGDPTLAWHRSPGRADWILPGLPPPESATRACQERLTVDWDAVADAGREMPARQGRPLVNATDSRPSTEQDGRRRWLVTVRTPNYPPAE